MKECFAPNHPLKPELGKRAMPFSRELWIEREDFMEEPSKGYHRLYPGNMARLRYGFVIKCIGCDKDAEGKVIAVHCEYLADSKSGTPGFRHLQGQRQSALGVSGARLPGRSTPLRPAVLLPVAGQPPNLGMPKAWSAISLTTSTRTACR